MATEKRLKILSEAEISGLCGIAVLFFANYVDVNSVAEKDAIVKFWSEKDLTNLNQAMTPEALKQNASQFMALQRMKLTLLDKYGEYNLASVRPHYDEDHSWIL